MALLFFCCKGFLNPDHDRELYDALDLARDATPVDIKRSFRRLSLRYHPDKIRQRGESMTPDLEGRFQKVKDAHAVLSVPRKRRLYDQLGSLGVALVDNPQSVRGEELASKFKVRRSGAFPASLVGCCCIAPRVRFWRPGRRGAASHARNISPLILVKKICESPACATRAKHLSLTGSS